MRPNATDDGPYVLATVASPATKLPLIDITDTGKTVVYRQLPEEAFRKFLPPTMGDYLVHMPLYIQDFGYYGANTEELVAWTAGQARGTLHCLEDYFADNPLELN